MLEQHRTSTDPDSGGPAGLIYGFILIWLGNFSVFICIGELASAVPTAGGQYHWVSLLAPRSNKRFFSYITGTPKLAQVYTPDD